MFLRLDTDSGVSGYGEVFTSSLFCRPLTLATLLEEAAEDFLIGHDPRDLELLYWRVHNSHYSHTGDLTKSAILSGMEMACWDISGKALGLPVYMLLGGQVRSKVRMYTYILPPSGEHPQGTDFWRDPDRVAAQAEALLAQGFTAVKFDPFPTLTNSDTLGTQLAPVQLPLELLDSAEAVTQTLRRRLGTQCDIILGTHGQLTASAAIRLAKRLESCDPLWFEEPVPPEIPSEMARVARATTIPVTAGERLTSKWEFARLITHGAAAVLNFDVSQVGGLLEAKKIAAMAEAHYLQVSPHIYGGPLVAAASLQFAVTVPNLLIMEGNGTYDGIYSDILDTRLDWRNGFLTPSDRPGLGHDLNEPLARQLRATETARFQCGRAHLDY